jgi:glycosyltransferase 2 family protein
MTLKARLWLALRIVITLGLLSTVFFDAGLRAKVAALPAPSAPGWLAAAWVCAGICELASLVRFWCCLRLAGVAMPLQQVTLLHFAGLFASLFLPGTAGGDALKLALILLQFPGQKLSVVLALLLDRLSGFIVIVAWTAVAAFARDEWFARSVFANGTLRTVLIIAGPLAGSLIVWFLVSRTGLRMPAFPMRERLLECEAVFDTLAKRWRLSGLVFMCSAAAFAAHFLVFHFAALAFGAPLSVVDSFSAMPLIDVVTMLPITIAGIGLREHAFQHIFAPLCGLSAGQAVITSLGGFLIGSTWALLGAVAFLYIRPAMKNVPPNV